jgi:sensor histidine kinase YesM
MGIKKKIRAKNFGLKELRISIAHMVLWSLLIVAFFTFLAIELGERIERGPLYFFIVFLGYVIIVIILPLFFTHRFLGPFERLKTELKIILSGDYHRRLSVRGKDDFYIKSFIIEIDKMLNKHEKACRNNQEFCKKIEAELKEVKSVTQTKELTKEELRDALNTFQKNLKHLLKQHSM